MNNKCLELLMSYIWGKKFVSYSITNLLFYICECALSYAISIKSSSDSEYIIIEKYESSKNVQC